MSMYRARRWILRGMVFGVFTIFVAFLAGIYLLRGSMSTLDGALSFSELGAPVSIERDEAGTTTITAKSRADISFALGFVHAQERFFSMDLMRRKASGELAELFGPRAIAIDKTNRGHGLRATVETAYRALSPGDRLQLQRYAAGVNQGLSSLRVRPWEYLALRQAPRRWLPEDSLLVVAAMYMELNRQGNNERELHLAELRAVMSESAIAFLSSKESRWQAPMSGSIEHMEAITPSAIGPGATRDGADGLRSEAMDAEKKPGSNAFAVAGRFTMTGSALVANDMHLPMGVPNTWFRVRLRYGGTASGDSQVDVNGLTLPGTPMLVTGDNGKVAWGFTNSYGDWADWVRVVPLEGDAEAYATPNGHERLVVSQEVIKVSNGDDVTLAVKKSIWGPVLAHDVDGAPLALQWNAQFPRSYNMRLLNLETTGNVHDALAVAHGAGMPVQNFIAGDSQGHIGWTLAGNGVPIRDTTVRTAGQHDAKRTGAGWTGWLDPSDYPTIEDPSSGLLWSANNRAIGDGGPQPVADGGYDLGARAAQIRDDLLSRKSFTPSDMLAIQRDDRALFLERWHQLLQHVLAAAITRHPEHAGLHEVQRRIDSWDGTAGAASEAYGLVRRFHDDLTRAVLNPYAGAIKARFPDFSWPEGLDAEEAVWRTTNERPPRLLDPKYASWDALLDAECVSLAADLHRAGPEGIAATWGEQNALDIEHPLSGALPDFLSSRLDVAPLPQAGDDDMPLVAGPDFGASERMVAMPGHGAMGILEAPGGQSSHPLSGYFRAGYRDWLDGAKTPLLPGQAVHRLQLNPKSS